jgi:uncharacterized protein YyaL (SSP411 family)
MLIKPIKGTFERISVKCVIINLYIGMVTVYLYAVPRENKMSIATNTYKYTNKLINENSPYLLQHAHNPVDWYPWSDEAFEIAVKEDKPVFLSIGYSSCHWCHVMERESFADEQTAKIMNEHFACIKVDREERPDIDAVYMRTVQMMTGGGGWPLSVFLTPQGKPFYGGTYFPPKEAFGRPSFQQLLLAIADAWENKREQLLSSADKASEMLAKLNEQDGSETLSPDILKKAYAYFESIFDNTYGGFGAAPKFPQPDNLSMLLGYWYRTKNDKALVMVEKTLGAMAAGGIHDHLGGGFHRYSTDAKWLTPHFEKVLYDQALLSKVYLQTYQITKNDKYAEVAKEIFGYVLRDMTDSKGGFYTAEDADSEGHEGAFYVGDPAEIKEVLGTENAEVFNEFYGVTQSGNFEHNKSILNINSSIEALAEQFQKDHHDIENILSQSRSKLLNHRKNRPRPYRDDKIITGWNGLMISSLAYGGAVLQDEKYINAATKCADFVLEELVKDNRLRRYYRNGQVDGLAVLDDYAFMILGLLDLYEATFDVRWLTEAKKLSEQMIELFSDQNGGAFYLTGKDAESLIVRNKPDYDGAVPSGNSIASLVLLKLGQMTMNQSFTKHGEQIFRAFSMRLTQSPASQAALLAAFNFWLGPKREIVIAGDLQQDETREILKVIHSRFMPDTVTLFHKGDKSDKAIYKIVPFIEHQTAIDGKATVYVCQNYVCKQPVHTARELEKLLLDSTKK